MTFNVVILPRAEQDFAALYEYIARRSPQGAATWVNSFYQSLKRLEINPKLYALAPESADSEHEVYQLVFKTPRGNPYRALFTVTEDHVFIRHIRGYGQDLVKDLGEFELP